MPRRSTTTGTTTGTTGAVKAAPPGRRPHRGLALICVALQALACPPAVLAQPLPWAKAELGPTGPMAPVGEPAAAATAYITGADVTLQQDPRQRVDGLHVTVWGTPASRVRIRAAGRSPVTLTEVSPGTYQAVLPLSANAANGRLGASSAAPRRLAVELDHQGQTVSSLLEAPPATASTAAGQRPAVLPHIHTVTMPAAALAGRAAGATSRQLHLQGTPGGLAVAWVRSEATTRLVVQDEHAPGEYAADIETPAVDVMVELDIGGRTAASSASVSRVAQGGR